MQKFSSGSSTLPVCGKWARGLFSEGRGGQKEGGDGGTGHSSLPFRGLRPFQCAERGTRSFFKEKGEPKDGCLWEHRHLPFRRFFISFFKGKGKAKRGWRWRSIDIRFFAVFPSSFSFSGGLPRLVPRGFRPASSGRQGFLFGEKEAEQKADGGHSMSSSFSAASCFSFSFFKVPPFSLPYTLLFF